MAIQTIIWTSLECLSCPSSPADVKLCVNPDKIAPHACPDGASETDAPFEFHTIDASLTNVQYIRDFCGVKSYKYTFAYEDAQIVEGETLEVLDITGFFCEGCFTSWVEDLAGNDVFVVQNDVGVYTLTNQHGCEFPLQVGDTFDFTVEADTGTPQLVTNGDTLQILGGPGIETDAAATRVVTITALLSDDPTNALVFDGDTLYVPGVEGNVPVGGVIPFGGAVAPAGWLLCDGSAVSRATYAALFGVIAVAYGPGNGATTFNVPDLRQRFPMGVAVSGTGSTLGGLGGNIDHTHSVPKHYHGMAPGADLNIVASGSHLHTIDHNHPEGNTGSSGDHEHFIIRSQTATFNNPVTNTAYLAHTGSGGNPLPYNLNGVGPGAADVGLTSFGGAHTHTFDVAGFVGNSGLATHTHATGDIGGHIGAVTGGVDGDADMTSGTANPPFQTFNFIIKT